MIYPLTPVLSPKGRGERVRVPCHFERSEKSLPLILGTRKKAIKTICYTPAFRRDGATGAGHTPVSMGDKTVEKSAASRSTFNIDKPFRRVEG